TKKSYLAPDISLLQRVEDVLLRLNPHSLVEVVPLRAHEFQKTGRAFFECRHLVDRGNSGDRFGLRLQQQRLGIGVVRPEANSREVFTKRDDPVSEDDGDEAEVRLNVLQVLYLLNP